MRRPFVAVALILLAALFVGCTGPGDPYPDNMFTQDVFPGTTNIFDLGSPALVWNNLYVTNINGAPFVPGAPGPHDLLSAVHTDTTIGAVTRGDLITGQGGVASWAKLALGGVGTFLKASATDVVWGTELDPVFSGSPSFGITALNIAGWNATVSSQWVTDPNGIEYTLGSVGINAPSVAASQLKVYSNNAVSNDPVLYIGENSASVTSIGTLITMAGAKTGNSTGMWIQNSTTSLAAVDKFGLRITSGSVWTGANYGLYIDTPVNGTPNYSIYSVGGANYLGGTLTLGTALAIANGGTGQITKAAAFDALSPMTTLGDMISGGAAGTGTRLIGDTTNTRKFLRTLSIVGVATAPVWDTIIAADLPSLSGTYIPYSGATANIDLNAKEVTNGTLNAMVLKGTFTASGTVTFPSITIGGTLQTGGVANYTLFAADGKQTMVGTARVVKDVEIPLTAFGKGVAAPATVYIGNYIGYEYSVNDTAYFCTEVPYDWDSTSDLKIELHWYIDEAYATAPNGEVRWNLIYTATKEDGSEAVDAATATIDSGDINIPATAKRLVQTELAIPAAGLQAHDVIGVQVKRVALVGGNNPTAKPTLIGALIEYYSNKLGE